MAKWFHGEKTANASGRGGTVFVADVSASMDMATLLPALRAVKAEIAGARVIAFADTAVEVHILRESYIPGVGGGTVMSAGLMRAEEMRPDLTIVMSDGLTSDRAICFDIADRMSGKISALYFEPQDDVELRCLYEQAETFMRELARRGGTFQPCDLRMGARHLTHSLLDIVRVREVHHHRGEARHIHCGHQHHTIQRTASSVRIIRR